MIIESSGLAGKPTRTPVRPKPKPKLKPEPKPPSDPGLMLPDPEAARLAMLRAVAQGHAEDALEALAWLMKNAASEAVRVSAANAVLDRALGRPVSGARAGGQDDHDVCGGLEVRWLDPGKS